MAHSDIQLDYESMMSQGLDSLVPQARQIHQGLTDLRKLGQLPFRELPYQEETLKKVSATAIGAREKFDHLLWIGTGGSALGVACLQKALASQKKGPGLTICDSLDPSHWQRITERLDWKRTRIVVASKSGNTGSTLAAYLFFRDRVPKDHLLFITDPEQGPLRKIAREEGIETLEIPPHVGGRFSVLTAVGLYPAAFLGIDIGELLAGARRMDERCHSSDLWINPSLLSASLHYLADTRHGRRIRVMMPYGERLNGYADWFVQLWAESLGKKFDLKGKEVRSGPTPLKARGPADQHSLLQLLLEGPADKTVTFLTVKENDPVLKIPAYSRLSELARLAGKGVWELQEAEREATARALTESGCPHLTLSLPRLSPFAVGQLLFLNELETVVSGGLYNVNPFDQPGVELIKKHLRELI